MDSLVEEIRTLIVEVLELEGIAPADIEPDMPLFGEGLELDSIDALEIGVALQKRFALTLDAEDPAIKEHFASVASLAALVAASRA
jgi:acyl carrier protein